ncbi:hypothetical protein G1C96_1230 [Bifidobacterium sp. DSM 109958]|uniref:Uncharacterized protein n=1 Tax=Bifidobacterium moraviense TaxID=2675323 RepID=A0A7Y0HXW8_9BIFI|nr:hypothetical protein [Bifidobacterium sp. DSM 109958]NMN00651.1 hypothetical protein [Bifidobacterium sp. DSM 109958]
MAGKKDKSLIYWSMNYRGKRRRTLVMLPLCVIIGVIAPFYCINEYGSVWPAVAFDVILAVTWVAQYLYTTKKAQEEAAQMQQAQRNPNQPQQRF